MNILKMYSNSVSIASTKSQNYYDVDFVIGDFKANHNGDKLNRDTISNWLPTLLHTHLVGNISKNVYGNYDFQDHMVKKVVNTDTFGNKYEDYVLDTSGFGTCIAVDIKDVDGEECVVARFRVFNRYATASNLIKDRIRKGILYSSWEINVKQSHYEGDIRVIDDGEFLSHCLLGSNVAPACDNAKLLAVASKNKSLELALLNDMEKEGVLMKKENLSTATEEQQVVENKDVVDTKQPEESTDVADSEVNDDAKKEEEAKVDDELAKLQEENEKLKKAIKEKDEAIAKLNANLVVSNASVDNIANSFKQAQSKIAELEVYKAQVEEIQAKEALAQKQAKEKALAEKITKLCDISNEDIYKNEELKTALASLDETKINEFIVKSMLENSNKDINTASRTKLENSKVDINSVSDDEDYKPDGSVLKSLIK